MARTSAFLLVASLLASVPLVLAHEEWPSAEHGEVHVVGDSDGTNACRVTLSGRVTSPNGTFAIHYDHGRGGAPIAHEGTWTGTPNGDGTWSFATGPHAVSPEERIYGRVSWSDASGRHALTTQEDQDAVCFEARFYPRAGNEWWVEVGALSGQPLAGVQASLDNATWRDLTKRDWGEDVWAKSFHVPPGSFLRFRALNATGDVYQATECYRWPPPSTSYFGEPCPNPPPPERIVFDHKGGNEWWVEAAIAGETPSAVQARDTGGDWRTLTLRSWGTWAASFHIEPGHDVQFRATTSAGTMESCWFTHPQGLTPTGGQTCSDESAPPPAAQWYNASIWGIKGNEWWVEARVDDPVVRVEARVNGGDWQAMTHRWWGAWATSMHVPVGQVVQLRALRDDGLWGYQAQGWIWPHVTPYPGYGNAGSAFDAAFHNVKGNAGYQQVNVYATWNLDGVETSIDGGPWLPMERKAWGDWASTYPTPAGSGVRFRALGGDGSDISQTYAWPR